MSHKPSFLTPSHYSALSASSICCSIPHIFQGTAFQPHPPPICQVFAHSSVSTPLQQRGFLPA